MLKIKTQITILMVSLHLVRAGKFEQKHNFNRVYEIYVDGLERMKKKNVDRNHPMIRLLILTLTKQLEMISESLKKPGADDGDLRNALETLKGVPGVSQPANNEDDKKWIMRFEERLKGFQT